MKAASNRILDDGFTLVEIAVAVAILGVALVSLIGLHTRMMNTYINEQNRFQAALALQYVASIIETEPEPPDTGSTSKAFESHLEELGFFDDDTTEQRNSFRFGGWQFQQFVEAIGLPVDREELAEDAIRKVSFQVRWGETEDEQYTLVYFVSNTVEVPAQAGGTGTVAGSTTAGGTQ